MIRVKVELVSARTGKVKLLGTARIWNLGTGTRTQGNYGFILRGKAGKVIDTGWLHRFPRTRLLGWDLLYRCLRVCRGDRNGDNVTQGQREALTGACTVPPPGWACTRKPGHDGPCAAIASKTVG